MVSIELMVFDLDGTLVDSREDIANAVNFMLKELGNEEKSLSQITSYIGMGVKNLIKKSLDVNAESSMDRALSICEGYYRKHSAYRSRLYPGVRDTLELFWSPCCWKGVSR